MNRRALVESLRDNNIRIDTIIWLAANACSISDDLSDFLQHECEAATSVLGSEPPVLESELGDYLTELCRKGVNGYLVRVSIPVYTGKGGTTVQFSWGHTYTRWFYFEQWDETQVHDAAAAWEKELRDAATSKKSTR
ncbi:MAG TPA: hypothetical protein VD994_19710 [Prosthecobacter sp.]|nr:hypothetical protein [Prosthecobacter sp.]